MAQRITLTYERLMASSRDAGNASMRKAGRKAWNVDDSNAAAEVAERLRKHLFASYAESNPPHTGP